MARKILYLLTELLACLKTARRQEAQNIVVRKILRLMAPAACRSQNTTAVHQMVGIASKNDDAEPRKLPQDV